MKYIYLLISILFLLSGCKTTSGNASKPRGEGWFNIAVAEDVEIYTDTLSIRHEGPIAYAREKRVYISPESKKIYVDKIRDEYIKLGKPEKADKWNDFSYCIYNCLYECTNKRFRILSVEDFDSAGKRIAKTTPAKNNIKWLNVDSETVGDYTFFFVCDYGQ
ncbi:surface-adhesin E family protein [Prevotella sp. 10(H)]|uniref:surface-adhesin E family protein n=1 Tax=Prevotella sp. 10(H) TaxID=1158294 RepID=UPI0004A760CF|nr:surface-adhesin E family protein [Prevotella sp. 10(H)]